MKHHDTRRAAAARCGSWPAAGRISGLLLGLAITFGCAAQQAVSVESLDRRDGAALELPGWWFPLAGARPAPAMLLLHGCGGVSDRRGELALRYRNMATRLNTLGVAVLVTDSLTPRGERELCTQRIGGRAVTQQNRRRDALGALRWLARQPGVDPQRIGLLGWSHGGSTVLAATNLRHREVAQAATRPSLAVAYYPGCASELRRGYEGVAPLLMLIGEADDWTPAEPCKQLAALGSGAPVQAEIFAGAFHGFDGTEPVRVRRDVPNGVEPGQGVHVGADPAARAAAAAELESFVQRHWQLPRP